MEEKFSSTFSSVKMLFEVKNFSRKQDFGGVKTFWKEFLSDSVSTELHRAKMANLLSFSHL